MAGSVQTAQPSKIEDLERQQQTDMPMPRYYPDFYNRVPFLVPLDFLIRPWAYLRASKLAAVRYVIAGCSFYGGMLFTIGACAGSAPRVVNTYSGKGWDATYPWIVTFTYFIGTYIFTTGCFLLTVEALNLQYDEDLARWKAGNRSSKPRFRLCWIEPKNIGWWAGVSYTFGALLYNVGSTSNLANTFNSVTMSPDEIKYLGLLTFLLGGPFFLTSGFLYVVQYSGNPLKGMFIPFNKADATSMTWWVNWFNWYGGVGFCMSGFWEYWYTDIPIWEYRIQNIIGFGVGGFCFTAGGFLLYAQASISRCRIAAPEELPAVYKGDDSDEGVERVLNGKDQIKQHDVLGWAHYNNAPTAPAMVG